MLSFSFPGQDPKASGLSQARDVPLWSAYALTVPLTLAALGVTLALPTSDQNPSFMLFLLATTLVAVTGRWQAALLSVLESVLLACYFVLPPQGFAVGNPDHQLRLALFVVCGVILSLAVARSMSARIGAAQIFRRPPAAIVEIEPQREAPALRIHRSAQVHPTAIFAQDVTILEGAQVAAGARLGEGASLGRGAAVGENAVLGDRVRLGDRCLVGENVFLGRGAEIGAHAVIAPGVRVAPGARVPPSCRIAEDVPAPAARASFL